MVGCNMKHKKIKENNLLEIFINNLNTTIKLDSRKIDSYINYFETMKKIVDGAPSDATDIDHTGAYWKDDLIMVDGKYQEDTRGWP